MKSFLKLLAVLAAFPREAIWQWWLGGVWVHHRGEGWVRAEWADVLSERPKCEYLRDVRGHSYHRTLVSIIEIRDFS